MKEIIDLPEDVFHLVRSFFYPVSLREETPQKTMELYLFQELKRSWRNFLSVSGACDWQNLRKRLFIFSLNYCESDRFFRDVEFSYNLKDRTINTAEQIQCHLRCPSQTDLTSKFMSFINLGFLQLQNFCGEEIPSAPKLHTLILNRCKKVTTLGIYENLKCLEISLSPQDSSLVVVKSVGSLPVLTELYLDFGYRRKIEALFQSFPLENLELLFFGGFAREITRFFPRLQKLKVLNLIGGCCERTLAKLTMNLERLTFRGGDRQELDLTGLHRLQYLDIGHTFQLNAERGKIYSQLKSLAGLAEAFRYVDLSVFPNVKSLRFLNCNPNKLKLNDGSFNTISDLVLHAARWSRLTHFIVSEKLKALDLSVNDVDDILLPSTSSSQDRHFHAVSLLGCHSLHTISMFQNVYKFHLDNCPLVRDIHSLQRIPYLTIGNCDGIEDFSCLGSYQQYLEIFYCSGLENRHFWRNLEMFLSSRLTTATTLVQLRV
jgi:hypothetical protein